jgi:hypothetical protein
MITMTFGVTIGHVEKKDIRVTMIECPRKKKDICSKEFTMYPSRSTRSGSHSGLGHFLWKIGIFNTSIPFTRSITAGDVKIAKEIHVDDFTDPEDRDIVVWVKYWVLKAVELYGDNAAIRFS